MKRNGFTLIEVLTVISIISLLIGILLPAVQAVREASAKLSCKNNLRQIALATHHSHDTLSAFPPAMRRPTGGDRHLHLSWLSRILPYIEQQPLWDQIEAEYRSNPIPSSYPRHKSMSHIVRLFGCPSDPDANAVHQYDSLSIALTSYLGNLGRDSRSHDGVIYIDSAVRIEQIRDGASQTLLAGERPASPEKRFGWWYIGYGQDQTGSLDYVLGSQELNRVRDPWYRDCGNGPFSFQRGDPN